MTVGNHAGQGAQTVHVTTKKQLMVKRIKTRRYWATSNIDWLTEGALWKNLFSNPGSAMWTLLRTERVDENENVRRTLSPSQVFASPPNIVAIYHMCGNAHGYDNDWKSSAILLP
jgi:hypothetical protein